MSILAALLTFVACVALAVVLVFVGIAVIGHFRLQLLRAQAAQTIPREGEVWIQDGEPLYIKASARHGVLLFALGDDKKLTSWWESWDDWHKRVKNRIVTKSNTTWKMVE